MKNKMTRLGRTVSYVLLALLCSVSLAAQDSADADEDRWVKVGAGIRAGFGSVEDGAPSGKDRSKDWKLESVRLYANGQLNKKFGFTFNTECEGCVFGQDANDPVGAKGDIVVLDAILRLEFSKQFNIWVGRMLTPADRIELNGPYYGLTWNQFTVPLLPSDQLGQAGLLGRDDGMTIWGAGGKLQYAVGLFDGVDGGPNQDDNMLFAGRVAYNFLNMESNPGYYTSSTYFGTAGDIFTVGLSYQSQADGTGTATSPGDFNAVIADVLYEEALAGGAAFTVEAEYKVFDSELTAEALAGQNCFCLFDGDAYFVSVAYLFGEAVGPGQFQPYVRRTENTPELGLDSDLIEVGLNYVIDGHNLRLNVNYTDGDANLTGAAGRDANAVSFGVQIQM
ncbi:MAG: porin [Acidobacteriota bacterium]|nr:porin [Acidobacteriota bacterium]